MWTSFFGGWGHYSAYCPGAGMLGGFLCLRIWVCQDEGNDSSRSGTLTFLPSHIAMWAGWSGSPPVLGAFPMAKKPSRLFILYPPMQESWGLDMWFLRGIWYPIWGALSGGEGDMGKKQRRQWSSGPFLHVVSSKSPWQLAFVVRGAMRRGDRGTGSKWYFSILLHSLKDWDHSTCQGPVEPYTELILYPWVAQSLTLGTGKVRLFQLEVENKAISVSSYLVGNSISLLLSGLGYVFGYLKAEPRILW